jgi:hypothetical protein
VPNPSHPVAHEVKVLSVAFADGEQDRARLAQQLAECDDCLAYAFQTIDDLSALHTIARSRAATTLSPRLGAIARLDALLDDVMVLRAHRLDPDGSGGGGEKAKVRAKVAVPMGQG